MPVTFPAEIITVETEIIINAISEQIYGKKSNFSQRKPREI